MCNISLKIVDFKLHICEAAFLIKYRFQDFPSIVADGKGEFYQLLHCENNYSNTFRKLDRILNNGVTEGY